MEKELPKKVGGLWFERTLVQLITISDIFEIIHVEHQGNIVTIFAIYSMHKTIKRLY